MVFSQELPDSIQNISFQNESFSINGTIRIPKHKTNQKLPAILIVHGSGATDRNGTFVENGFTFQSYLGIAEYFFKKGFVVLTYDKRNFTLLKNNKIDQYYQTMPEVYIKDAQSAIEYLGNQEVVDPTKIIVIGHSEGGSLIPKIISGHTVKLAICLSPGLLRVDNQIIYQLNYQIKSFESIPNKNKEINDALSQLNQVLNNIKDDINKANISKDGNEVLKNLGLSVSYFNHLKTLTENIVDDLKKVEIPLLIINGDADLKCPAELLKEKEVDLKQNKFVEIVYINNMFHEPYIYDGKSFTICNKAMSEIEKWIISKI